MTAMEFMARLAALIAPPRYPLVRYAGVLGPRSAWRKNIVPKPRERRPACDAAAGGAGHDAVKPPAEPKKGDACPQRSERPREAAGQAAGPMYPRGGGAATVLIAAVVVARPGDIVSLAPNVISVRHWDRLLGGALYAATPRLDWATLMRRSFDVDVLACAKCGGRLRVLAVITQREPLRRILAHLGLDTEAPPLARARDPTDDLEQADACEPM